MHHILIYLVNAFWYAVGSWSNVLIWPTYEVPVSLYVMLMRSKAEFVNSTIVTPGKSALAVGYLCW